MFLFQPQNSILWSKMAHPCSREWVQAEDRLQQAGPRLYQTRGSRQRSRSYLRQLRSKSSSSLHRTGTASVARTCLPRESSTSTKAQRVQRLVVLQHPEREASAVPICEV